MFSGSNVSRSSNVTSQKELMHRLLFCLMIVVSLLVTGCPKGDTVSERNASALHGMWIREGDMPGHQMADTLLFFSKSGKNLLAYRFALTAGFNWPAEVETEFKFQDGKFSVLNSAGGGGHFVDVESFQWKVPNKEFTVKLYQIVHYMSASYTVTYQKVK